MRFAPATVISAKLTIIAALALLTGTLHADCTSPAAPAGGVIYNSSQNVVQYCNGTSWVNTGPKNPSAANTGCTSPTGARGHMIYNATARVTQFCNGEKWVNMACTNLATDNPGSGCTGPTGPKGSLAFVTPANKLQMCDGSNWLNTGSLCPQDPPPPAGSGVPYCWGSGTSGRLGNGSTVQRTTPYPVTLPGGVTGFSSVFVSSGVATNAACGIDTKNRAYCWGNNYEGKLGNGTTTDSSVPVPVSMPSGVTGFTQIVLGDNATCALANTGKMYCWGSTYYVDGQSEKTSPTTPAALPSGVSRLTQIALGRELVCALGDNGRAYCMGYNNIGTGSSSCCNTYTFQPVNLPAGVTGFTNISAAYEYACAIGNDTRAYCWGKNESGNLGDGSTTNSTTPVAVTLPSGVSGFVSISTGGSASNSKNTCAISNTNLAYCWGKGAYGALGNGAANASSVPVQVTLPSGVTSFKSISVGNAHVCALADNQRVYCWGKGVFGELGNGTTAGTNATPVPVSYPAGKTRFESTGFSCAIAN